MSIRFISFCRKIHLVGGICLLVASVCVSSFSVRGTVPASGYILPWSSTRQYLNELLEQLLPRDVSGWESQWASGVFYVALLTVLSALFGHFALVAAAAFFYIPLFILIFKRLSLPGLSGLAAFLFVSFSPSIVFGSPHLPGVLYSLAAMSGVWSLLCYAKSRSAFDLRMAVFYLPFGFYSPQVLVTSSLILILLWLNISDQYLKPTSAIYRPVAILVLGSMLTVIWTIRGTLVVPGFRVEYEMSDLEIFSSSTRSPYEWLTGGGRPLTSTDATERFYWSFWWPSSFAIFYIGLLRTRFQTLVVTAVIIVSIVQLTSDRSYVLQSMFVVLTPLSSLFRNVTYLVPILGSVASFGLVRFCIQSGKNSRKSWLLFILALIGAGSSLVVRLSSTDIASMSMVELKTIENRFRTISIEDSVLEIPQYIGKSQSTEIYGLSIMPSAMWMSGSHPVLFNKGKKLDCTNVAEIKRIIRIMNIEKVIYLGSEIVSGFDVSCFSSLKLNWKVIDEFSDGWVATTGLSNTSVDLSFRQLVRRAANLHTLILYAYLIGWLCTLRVISKQEPERVKPFDLLRRRKLPGEGTSE